MAPWELVGIEDCGEPITADELASAIRENCRVRNMTLDEFGDAAGWDVSKAVNTPPLLLAEYSLDGIKEICRELGLDWRPVIRSLSTAA